ncbi:MAG: lysylphosphatidylglycerol synthase transmembrane domain-containing protein [Polyangiaceae bacterium]
MSSPRRSGFLRHHAVKLAASVVITALIVYTVQKGGLKIVPEGGDFQRVRWYAVPAYFFIFLAMTWFRAVRWRFLLRSIADVRTKKLLTVSGIGFAAILLLPFRLGEIVRPYLIRTPPRYRATSDSRPVTLTAAMSSVVAERIIDGFCLSVILALALFFVPTVQPLPDKVVGIPVTVEDVRMSGYAMLGVFAVAFGTIVVFYFARGWAHRATVIVVGAVSMPLATKLTSTVEKFSDGLHAFGRAKDAIGFLLETLIYWGLNGLGVWLLAWACGIVHADGSAPTFGEACAMMGMVGCAILIPGPPGLLGVFQAGLYAGMTMFYPTEIVTGPGPAFVFVTYAAQFVFTVGIGAAGLWLERGGIRALERAEDVLPAAVDAS